MRCPFCQVDNDKVIDSRACEDSFAIRRRRECIHCKGRYTTYERLEDLTIKVVKKNGVREPFSRDKIRLGLRNACWKRPVSDEQIDAVIDAVANAVLGKGEDEVDTRELGELVMEKLRTLDQVAYVRFASVYRQFKDVRDFVSEVSDLDTLLPPKDDKKDDKKDGKKDGKKDDQEDH